MLAWYSFGIFVATPTDFPSGETAIAPQDSSSACAVGTTATANAATAAPPAAKTAMRVRELAPIMVFLSLVQAGLAFCGATPSRFKGQDAG
ncbi:hypothetical protein MBRA_19460 [Mycobacterium branderi]|uniref:Lipoprotein LpqS n=1 Tax=Mycobacterium branderi TaxID=43348 RepID=A0ABM7KKU5_9MYCO|nr:hypothetical protein MBRA_19460 [Mycobacterium branderi]